MSGDRLDPELERVARMLADAGPLPHAPETLRERVLAISDEGEPEPKPEPELVTAARRRRRWPRPAVLAGIAAVLAALVIVPTAIVVRDDGGSQSIALDPRPFAPNGGGSAEVVRNGDGSATISLRVWKLPRAGDGRVYETWLGRKGDRRPLGDFQVGDDGRATVSYTLSRKELEAYSWVWVTSEPEGPPTQPSETAALWGALT